MHTRSSWQSTRTEVNRLIWNLQALIPRRMSICVAACCGWRAAILLRMADSFSRDIEHVVEYHWFRLRNNQRYSSSDGDCWRHVFIFELHFSKNRIFMIFCFKGRHCGQYFTRQKGEKTVRLPTFIVLKRGKTLEILIKKEVKNAFYAENY